MHTVPLLINHIASVQGIHIHHLVLVWLLFLWSCHTISVHMLFSWWGIGVYVFLAILSMSLLILLQKNSGPHHYPTWACMTWDYLAIQGSATPSEHVTGLLAQHIVAVLWWKGLRPSKFWRVHIRVAISWWPSMQRCRGLGDLGSDGGPCWWWRQRSCLISSCPSYYSIQFMFSSQFEPTQNLDQTSLNLNLWFSPKFRVRAELNLKFGSKFMKNHWELDWTELQQH